MNDVLVIFIIVVLIAFTLRQREKTVKGIPNLPADQFSKGEGRYLDVASIIYLGIMFLTVAFVIKLIWGAIVAVLFG
jgi:hypothetical protein